MRVDPPPDPCPSREEECLDSVQNSIGIPASATKLGHLHLNERLKKIASFGPEDMNVCNQPIRRAY